jgi:Na+/melibiose symporter-like transporter
MNRNFFYGLGSLGYSVIGQTISNFFMFFATSILGLKGSLVGIVIAISTVWDGISDSIMGFLSDNYRLGRLGKRNGYMLIATIGMTIFNLVLWCVPTEYNEWIKLGWILISLLLLETFNTMFATPYTALGNDISKSYHDRTKVNAFKTVFYLIGIIIPSALLVIFLPSTSEYPIGQLNPRGYVNIAIVTSIICLVVGIICSLSTIPPNTEDAGGNKKVKLSLKKLFRGFSSAFKHKKLRRLIWGYVMTTISTVFLCSVGLHFFTYSFFYSSSQITILLLSLMIGTIVSQPLWVWLSKKRQKKPALILGILLTIISVFGIISVYIFRIELYEISFYIMVVLIFICGIGSGAIYTLPVSIYGDAIDSIKGGDNKIATYGSAISFASNIANSITQLIVGTLLDIIKFDSSLEVQSLGVQTGLALIVFIGVQASLIIGCSIFASFREKILDLNQ